MSEQNLELIRRIYHIWSREESARELIAEDVEYVNPSYAVEPGTRRGRKSFAVVRDTYEDFNVKVERFVDTDGDDVVVLARYTASGRGSGVPLEGRARVRLDGARRPGGAVPLVPVAPGGA
jgi:ketosteroid isomerase-like protein